MKKLLKNSLVYILIAAMLLAIGCAAPASAPADASASEAAAAPATEATIPEQDASQIAAVPSEAGKETARIAVNQKLDVVDGSNGNGIATQVMLNAGEPLARISAEGGIDPCLATSWEMLDELTWQFKLRDDADFTNGEHFNAEAVATTIAYITEYFRYSGQFGSSWPLTTEIIDDYTINIISTTYCPDLPSLLARVAIFAPKQYAEEGAEAFFTHTVFTGAYKLEAFDPGLSITLTANESYRDGAPAVKTLVFDWVSDESARVAGLKSGEYDFVYVVPLSQVEALRGEGYNVELYETVGTDIIFCPGNARAESWTHDETFRKALSYAIDHEAIRQSLFNGYVESLAGVAHVSTLGANPTDALTYDPDMAKQLLTECGYDGATINFHYFTGEFSGQDEVCEVVASYLEAVGISVDLQSVEEAAYTDEVKSGKVDLVAQRMPGPYYGVSTYYYRQLGSALRGIKYDDVTELVEKANAFGLSEAERESTLKEANALLWSKRSIVWGVHEVASNGVNANLKGYVELPNSFVMFNGIYFE